MDKRINIKSRDRVPKGTNDVVISQISNSWLFKIFVLVVSGVIFYSVFNSVKLTIQKLEILRKAEQEVEELRLENLHLSIGIKDMSTDKYLEKEARDRLNFGGKGEIVFVIPDSTLELAKKKVDSIVNPEVESVYENGNNINEWMEFLITGV